MLFTKSNVLLWRGRGSWAITDQGIFALSNFFLNLLLARWLNPEQYGAFAVGFTIFLLLGNLHAGLLIEPMLVFGTSKYSDCRKEYFALLQSAHWVFSVLGSILLMACGIGVWHGGMTTLSVSLWGFALVGPSILFLWLMRRFCYVELEPHLAAHAGGLYFVLMVAGISVLHLQESLSVFLALTVIGIASLGSALWLSRNFKVVNRPPYRSEFVFPILNDHRRYGKWAAGTNVMMWMPANITFLFLPGFVGLEGAGALKALLNLIMPIQQSFAALGTILVPILVGTRGKSGYGNILYSNLFLFGGLAVLYWCFLFWFAPPLMSWLYKGMYDSYNELLWFIGLLPILASAVTVFGSSLRALEQPGRVFVAYGISSAFSTTFGLLMTAWWGVLGALFSIVLTYMITALSLWILHARFKDPTFFQKGQEILEAAR
jgi:O-antigen/teichoic acid export membrane protein